MDLMREKLNFGGARNLEARKFKARKFRGIEHLNALTVRLDLIVDHSEISQSMILLPSENVSLLEEFLGEICKSSHHITVMVQTSLQLVARRPTCKLYGRLFYYDSRGKLLLRRAYGIRDFWNF